MAKKREPKESFTIEVTPRDIAKSLEGIAEWALSVRKAVLLLDQNNTARVRRPVPHVMSIQPWLDGCPPKDPCDDDGGRVKIDLPPRALADRPLPRRPPRRGPR